MRLSPQAFGQACFARVTKNDHLHDHVHVNVDVDVVVHVLVVGCLRLFENPGIAVYAKWGLAWLIGKHTATV